MGLGPKLKLAGMIEMSIVWIVFLVAFALCIVAKPVESGLVIGRQKCRGMVG